ncbi:MAG: hypothetical protein ACK50K_05865 [Betaproteobacteria bacterium]
MQMLDGSTDPSALCALIERPAGVNAGAIHVFQALTRRSIANLASGLLLPDSSASATELNIGSRSAASQTRQLAVIARSMSALPQVG